MTKLPGWLLTRTAALAVAGVVLLAAFLWWSHSRDQRLKREAIAVERIRVLERERVRQDSVIVARTDTLRIERARTDTVVTVMTRVITKYETIRVAIDTSRAAQPAGTPDSMTVVPTAYVVVSDSLARLVPVLIARIESERIASTARIVAGDSARVILVAEIEQLRIAAKLGRTGWGVRLKYAAIGGVIVFAVDRLAGR